MDGGERLFFTNTFAAELYGGGGVGGIVFIKPYILHKTGVKSSPVIVKVI